MASACTNNIVGTMKSCDFGSQALPRFVETLLLENKFYNLITSWHMYEGYGHYSLGADGSNVRRVEGTP